MRIEMYLLFMGVTTSGTDLNLFKPIQTGLHKTKADSRRKTSIPTALFRRDC